jgi:hypothetical protein
MGISSIRRATQLREGYRSRFIAIGSTTEQRPDPTRAIGASKAFQQGVETGSRLPHGRPETVWRTRLPPVAGKAHGLSRSSGASTAHEGLPGPPPSTRWRPSRGRRSRPLRGSGLFESQAVRRHELSMKPVNSAMSLSTGRKGSHVRVLPVGKTLPRMKRLCRAGMSND